MKTVSLCVSVHGSLAVVKIKSTTSLFYQVRNMPNYAVECTCQTKLKVCVSVFDLVSWRRGQTTVAVSAYTRTLVGTTHTVRVSVQLCLVKLICCYVMKKHQNENAHDTTYVFPGNPIFVSAFDFDWLLCIMNKASKRKRFQHSCRKEFQWLRYDEARNVIWCKSYDGA